MDGYSNYNDVPRQGGGYVFGANQRANWYMVETTRVERVRGPASRYTNVDGGRQKNELFGEYMPEYAVEDYHEEYEVNYGPVYENSKPPNFQENEDLMNKFLNQLQIDASRPTKTSNISGPNRYLRAIPNNNWPKDQPHTYPSQDTRMGQNIPVRDKYRPSSPTKYGPSSPTKYRPSSPNKYRPSDLNRYPPYVPNKYPSSPPKYQPSSPTKYRPSSPTKYRPSSPKKYPPSGPNKYPSSPPKYRPSSPTKYRPSSPTKYRRSSPTKYQPSSPNKYQPSDPTKYLPPGPNKYPSSPPKYRPSSPTKYRPSSQTKYESTSPIKYSPSSPTKYRSYSPTKYRPSSPTKYRSYSPTKYRPSSPTKYRSSNPNKYRQISPTKYQHTSPTKYQQTSPNKYQPTSQPPNYPSKGGHLNGAQNVGDPNVFRSNSPIDSFPPKDPPLDTKGSFVPNKHQPSTEGGKKNGLGYFSGPKKLWQSVGPPATHHPITGPTNNMDEALSYLVESGNYSPRSEPNSAGVFDNLSPRAQPVKPENQNTKPTFGGGIARRLFKSNAIDSQEAIKKYNGASVP